MRIGELARRTGVSERSLRYYEEHRLLTAERTAGGHREFPEEAVELVIRIQELFAAGLCSGKIARLLPCMPRYGEGRAASPELREDLLVQRDRLNGMVGDLLRAREVLDEVLLEVGVPAEDFVRPAKPGRT